MIDPNEIVGKLIARRESSYRTEDSILYALGLGFGTDPTDMDQLRFVYEQNIQTLPTMNLVLGYPGFWLKDPKYQVDWQKILHAEETLIIHNPLPPAGMVVGETYVDEIVDRGPEKGAFIYQRKEVRSESDGILFAEVISNTLARGDGGFGGPPGTRPKPPALPAREADAVCDLPTMPQQALLYRLCGDMNPLHADPAIARGAGFDRPILHGRSTMGVALHAVLKTCCGYDPTRLKSMSLRFSAPFLPGETLRTELWQEGSEIYFRSLALEREVVVLNNGHVELKD
ncbi:MAG: MaoC/PaaZ C-terminal domain-containing protein [Gammaproteobacteria bacterium]|nr:MaoC/PaaZ C-terminal domain-containing protein [Gammaproteobacteria bacterium]